jgi:hypothetical protein
MENPYWENKWQCRMAVYSPRLGEITSATVCPAGAAPADAALPASPPGKSTLIADVGRDVGRSALAPGAALAAGAASRARLLRPVCRGASSCPGPKIAEKGR